MLRDLTLTPASPAAARGLRGWVRAVAAVLKQWNHRRRSRAHLGALPPHMLRDIGLHQAEAEAEAQKPFWRA
jgi:uncharacterized protein YjiS (DUF1127 family)